MFLFGPMKSLFSFQLLKPRKIRGKIGETRLWFNVTNKICKHLLVKVSKICKKGKITQISPITRNLEYLYLLKMLKPKIMISMETFKDSGVKLTESEQSNQKNEQILLWNSRMFDAWFLYWVCFMFLRRYVQTYFIAVVKT